MGPVAISSDGSTLVGESIAVFAGAEGYGEAPAVIYESVRSPLGWETSALNPPSWLYPAQEFVDINPDKGRSLWEVHRASQSLAAEELAVREPNGSFVEVGPMLPGYAANGPPAGEAQEFEDFASLVYSGASSDLSHVLFQIRGSGPLWPGDTTFPAVGDLSLYEYVGTGNTQPPELVGLNENGELISDCGISLGSDRPPGGHNADTYNAISADGETVFFTALGAGECGGGLHAPLFDEVYARLGRTHTVSSRSRVRRIVKLA